MSKRNPNKKPERKGAIFIAALGIVVVLSGLLLVFAQQMRVEAVSTANRLSSAQAEAIERGAEQWVLAQIELNTADAVSITETPAEAIPVGGTVDSPAGYFWILKPDPLSTTEYAYGIQDEAAKVNINSATRDQLMELPNMTDELADSIIEWRGGTSTGLGAGSGYYNMLADPYSSKHALFETVEELLLVKDVTPDLLFGYDRNRNGVLEDVETAAQVGGALSSAFSTGIGDDGRGLFNYITVYSIQTVQTGGGGGGGRGGAGGGAQSQAVPGMVNVNTAPATVLQAIGMTQQEAESVVSYRTGGTLTSGTTWLSSAIGQQRANYFTSNRLVVGASAQFSADIVAVSADGRAFKRVRMVVDTRATPYTVVYRKELTDAGWPLAKEIRTSLRSGKGLGT